MVSCLAAKQAMRWPGLPGPMTARTPRTHQRASWSREDTIAGGLSGRIEKAAGAISGGLQGLIDVHWRAKGVNQNCCGDDVRLSIAEFSSFRRLSTNRRSRSVSSV